LNLPAEVVASALDFLLEGALLHLNKYNGNPIGLQLLLFVELEVAEAEPAVRGDTSSGSGTKDGHSGDGAESPRSALYQAR
jgi:elongation factor P